MGEQTMIAFITKIFKAVVLYYANWMISTYPFKDLTQE